MQDRRVPQDAHIYSDILPCVEGEVLHAQATAPTSGGTLIFAVAHPEMVWAARPLYWEPESFNPGLISSVKAQPLFQPLFSRL